MTAAQIDCHSITQKGEKQMKLQNNNIIKGFTRSLSVQAAAMVVFSVLAFTIQPVYAFGIPTENQNITIRWDNTLKYSNMYRLLDQDKKLIADKNTDDGNRNFDKGFVSNRFDIYSEFDAVYAADDMSSSFGTRFSTAAWYDANYNSSNDNNSPLTTNQRSVPYNQFTNGTKVQHGRNIELMDAFVFGRTLLGEGGSINTRVGRFAQVWGETLFLGGNGIAGTMSPVDAAKALSVPGTTFKEIIRPVAQISLDYQAVPDLTFNLFYQFQHEKTLLPASGSYFSTNDFLFNGGERLLLTPTNAGPAFSRGADMDASDNGQFGAAMKFRFGGRPESFGLYAVRYHSKTPYVYTYPAQSKVVQVFPEDIWAFAASANRTFGDLNIGTEVMHQRNAPLASNPAAVLPGVKADNSDNPLYAVGQTFHANISAIYTVPRTPLFDEAGLSTEFGFNRRLSVTKNSKALNPDSSRDAWGSTTVFTPTYRQVLNGLDMSVPVSLAYTTDGKSSVSAASFGGVGRGGTFGLGLKGTYEQVWISTLQYSKYLGDSTGAGVFSQTKADRDFISFSIQRTF